MKKYFILVCSMAFFLYHANAQQTKESTKSLHIKSRWFSIRKTKLITCFTAPPETKDEQ
jgi:hypothetical protein